MGASVVPARWKGAGIPKAWLSRLPALALGALLLTVAAPAPAQDEDEDEEDPYSRSGIYLFAGPLFAMENFKGTGTDSLEDAWGVAAKLGYRVMRYVSAEIHFEAPILFDRKRQGIRVTRLTAYVPTLSARLYPFQGRWQPYIIGGGGPGVFYEDNKLGVSDNTNVAFTGRAGAGLDLYGDENWVLNVEGAYVIPTGTADKFEYGMISFGFLWRF